MGIGSFVKRATGYDAVRNLVTNPTKGSNFLGALIDPGSMGLTQQFDRWTGGNGSVNSALNNRYIQTIGGAALSFIPGVGPYLGAGVGGLGAAIGGGNREDVNRGMMYGGLGSLAGSGIQSGVNWFQGGSGSAGGTPDITAEFGTEAGSQTGGYPAVAGKPDTVDVNALEAMRASGMTTTGSPYAAAERAPAARAAAGTGSPSLLSRITGANPSVKMMALKAGLGAYQNFQAQQALEDEMEERDRALRRIRAMEDNPELAYRNDPGLAAMRKRRMDDFESRYRAKYGGTEGGAFARGLAREGSMFDRAALNDRISREYQMLGVTAPAMQYNLAAGGTTGGAIAGPIQGAISDYALMQYLQGLE